MSEEVQVKKKNVFFPQGDANQQKSPPVTGVTLAKKNRDMLERMKPEFAKVLSKISPEYFLRVALSSINKNPKLLQCTTESILSCVMDLATLNLVPDSQRGFAWLIPYGQECQLQIGYLGYAEILYRGGEIQNISCQIVYKNDTLDYEYGTNAHLTHKPVLFERGEKIGGYSYVRFKDGTESFLVATIKELEEIKAKSKKDQNGKLSPAWREFEDEMYKKSVFRRHFKLLPRVDDSIRAVIEKDIDKDFEYDIAEKETQPTKRAKFDSNITVPQATAPVSESEDIQDADFEDTEESADEPESVSLPLTTEEATAEKKESEIQAKSVKLKAKRIPVPSDPEKAAKLEEEMKSLPFFHGGSNG